jgi:hypothetical protein
MTHPDFPPGISAPDAPETPENGHVPASENGAAGSRLDWLRARHAEITADRTLDKDVPGYGGRLVLRFSPVPWSVTGKLQAMLSGRDPDGQALLMANVDMLIAACREVLVQDDAGELVSVDPSGEPVRIEPRLAELLRLDTTSARQTLLWLFPSEFAVSGMAGEVLAWTQDADAESAGEFVGKFGPTIP